MSASLDKAGLNIIYWLDMVQGGKEQLAETLPTWVEEKVPLRIATKAERIKRITSLAGKVLKKVERENTNLRQHQILLIPHNNEELLGIGWKDNRLVVQTWRMPEGGKEPLQPDEAIARWTPTYSLCGPSYSRTEGVNREWLREVEQTLRQTDQNLK
ncbi:hypothetical protein E3I18_02460 [Candidatus Woesebacteria bacterium]|nr:MAG: hypothetical protein E3I18_02460 [Candidatus Woesebacteria bacterium]